MTAECAECADLMAMIETAMRLGSRPHRLRSRDVRYDAIRIALNDRLIEHQRGHDRKATA